ncbi:MAG: hypothetical protein ACI379_12825 [Nocardioides sp.]|uniref:DUF7937 domain-containing protein n=1 Tax=Nocardioides sp. TaxID=35761 RepID=UPI003F112C4C
MFAPPARVVPIAPSARQQSSPERRADTGDGPSGEARAGDTRARVRLYGIRSEMAAAKAAQELAAQVARESAEQAARYARAAQQQSHAARAARPVTGQPVGQPVRPTGPPAPAPSQISDRLGTTQKRAPLNSVVPGAPSPVRPRSNHELDGMPAEQRPSAAAPRGPRPVLVPSQQPRGEAARGPVAPPVQFGAPAPYGPAGGYAPAPPARPRRAVPLDNPFRRLVAVDAVKDVAALVCLVLALLLPWNATADGGRLWWVVVPVALTALALTVPYVMTSRLLPAFRPAQSAALKAALTAPLVLAALATLVVEVVQRGDGVGVSVAAALTGAALTAQPRRAEEVLGVVAEHWLANTAFVVAVVAVVLHVVAFPVYAVGVDAGGALGWFSAVLLLLAPPVTVLGFPAVSHAMGRTSGRRVFAVAGLTCLAVTVLAALDVPGFVSASVVERLGGASGGAFLVGAAAALALAHPAVRRTGAGVDPAVAWAQTARQAFGLTAATLVCEVLVFLSVLVFSDVRPGAYVGAVVLRAVAALLAVVAAVLLVDLGRRVAVLVLGAAVPLLAAVGWLLAAAATPDGLPVGLGPWQAAAWFALPALGLWSLTVPGPVRAEARRRSVRRVPTSWQPPQQAFAWAPPAGGPALQPPQPAPQPVPQQPVAPTPVPGYAPLAAVPPLAPVPPRPGPATFLPPQQPMTYVQSPGTTQTRRIPTGATPRTQPGQEWSGWRMPTAR